MSNEVNIKISGDALQAIARLDWGRLGSVIAAEMDVQNQLTIAHISQERMRGNNGKSFPVEMGILGIRTANLVRSLRASKTTVSSSGGVSSTIGTNVVYAGINEFGGVIRRTTKAGVARLRADNHGNLLRQPGRRGAIFASIHHKRVKEVAFQGGKSYVINIPARAPITHGIEDRADAYGAAVSKRILDFVKEGN